MRLVLFTDTLGDVNGVSRFIRNAAAMAEQTGRSLTVLTSTRMTLPDAANIRNVWPPMARPMPGYPNLEIVWAPKGKLMAAADRLQPDVVHVSTPGTVGMVGRAYALKRGCTLLGTYHTDFPAYVDHLFDHSSLTWATTGFMQWFYKPFARLFTRSTDYAQRLVQMGVPSERLERLKPGIDLELFHPKHRDESIWDKLGQRDARATSVKVVYAGRVSVEKNLPFLADVWAKAAKMMKADGLDAQLVVIGDGPYLARMKAQLAEQAAGSAIFAGFRHGKELSGLYANSDMFVFPSLTDTLGQVVMEAQASALPVIVANVGGPKEVVLHEKTGVVLPATPAEVWVEAIIKMVRDTERRKAMGRAAHEYLSQFTFAKSFEHFWSVHEQAHAARRGVMAGR
jgi:glycosyltransferase involved in cell wall biosynthesis